MVTGSSKDLVFTDRGLISVKDVRKDDTIIKNEYDLLRHLKKNAETTRMFTPGFALQNGLHIGVRYADGDYIWKVGKMTVVETLILSCIREFPPEGLAIHHHPCKNSEVVDLYRIRSLPINDPKASHRIVGTFTSGFEGHGTQSGIIGFYGRMDVADALGEMLRVDPGAELRVEPHNNALFDAPLRSTDVEWILNDQGEIGVKIGEQFFFCYKGNSFMYDTMIEGEKLTYRLVGKRELDEMLSIHSQMDVEDFKERGIWSEVNLSTARTEFDYWNSDRE